MKFEHGDEVQFTSEPRFRDNPMTHRRRHPSLMKEYPNWQTERWLIHDDDVQPKLEHVVVTLDLDDPNAHGYYVIAEDLEPADPERDARDANAAIQSIKESASRVNTDA